MDSSNFSFTIITSVLNLILGVTRLRNIAKLIAGVSQGVDTFQGRVRSRVLSLSVLSLSININLESLLNRISLCGKLFKDSSLFMIMSAILLRDEDT